MDIMEILLAAQNKYCHLLDGSELSRHIAIIYSTTENRIAAIEMTNYQDLLGACDVDNWLLIDTFTAGNQDPSGLIVDPWLEVIEDEPRLVSYILAREWLKLYIGAGLAQDFQNKLEAHLKK